uniref:Uncharacterized protein LOC100184116 n=1 Tax=Phallusia mammillata TaxID=59560 RepID=A0A6F9DHB5_9ASCI|nr:uncharacterized protein LOC100184116 [Phallusia mammillata]
MSQKSEKTPLGNFDEVPAAGYVEKHREVEEHGDHRRHTDGVLHFQNTPRVYPFANKTSKTADKENEAKEVSMYVSEFAPKPMSVRKFRPTSIHRRNNPHPNQAFHVRHMFNQGVPVVKTRMTLEEFNREPVRSPYVSNTHRSYREYQKAEIQRSKPARQAEESVTGIVPELNKLDHELSETRLFPVIPRNSRLTADKARELTNSVIKPRKNKYQPHLSDVGSKSDQVFPFLPIKDLNRPALKPLSVDNDTLKVASWDGAPAESARTTSRVFGRKRGDPTKVEASAHAVVPELSPPTSRSLMFKEYAQFPKYAPQMLQDYYSGRTRKGIPRPYVF